MRRDRGARCATCFRPELQALARFQSLLLQSLQTITVYVDTKDRSLGGGRIPRSAGARRAASAAL